MNEEIYRKYARLMLEAGIGLQRGQKVHVSLEAYHWDFAKILVEEAYRLGAGYVMVEAGDPAELRARVLYGEDLDYVPGWLMEKNRVMVREGWARVFFYGPTEPDMVAGLDQDRLQRIQKAGREAGQILSRAGGAGEIAWSGGALPTPGWAMKVFPEETEERALELLWGELVRILCLDAEDPSVVWRELGVETMGRGERLGALGLEWVHFRGPGTDLRVKCLRDAVWVGGGSATHAGVMTIPNLPTFENFTTPDLRGTCGRVRMTYPAQILGVTVKGAWLGFEDGKVVDYGADENADALGRMMEVCPQAAYLGEVALVDGSSPIYQSGKVFHSTLFDENATCHIALGSGYVKAASGAEGKSKSELLEMGVNVSLLHYDVMVGGDEVDVDGVTWAGEVVPLIRDGLFVF